MNCKHHIFINGMTANQLAAKYNVSKHYVLVLNKRCDSHSEIIEHLEYMQSIDYQVKQIFRNYIKLFKALIVYNYHNPSERQKLKHQYYHEIIEEGLPISSRALELGWSSIVRDVYNHMY